MVVDISYRKYLREKWLRLYADLYQRCATDSIESVESICRRIHILEMRLNSLKYPIDTV